VPPSRILAQWSGAGEWLSGDDEESGAAMFDDRSLLKMSASEKGPTKKADEDGYEGNKSPL
jgi:hypothetical protein